MMGGQSCREIFERVRVQEFLAQMLPLLLFRVLRNDPGQNVELYGFEVAKRRHDPVNVRALACLVRHLIRQAIEFWGLSGISEQGSRHAIRLAGRGRFAPLLSASRGVGGLVGIHPRRASGCDHD